ncbi:hypothetical protein OAI64_01075 [Schleiferiaceae bacterium]|jgi:hypothetical protein|nr:hypothetical protein [Schleiferiaceae bacterium]MDA9103296.1 hypothetical protein [Schleiferiaceae bacterium]MDA9946006.1 hypothetical protein [Schleiferiaceae bacterium]MDB0012973.1 hypothetical protein [Schleiferiaceae bacterium]MDC0082786.1 hypothetical protein [Schleiferiaceae bacterium]
MRQIVFFLILSTSLYAQNYPKEDIGAVVSKSSNSILLVLSHHRPDNLKFNLDSVVSNVNDTIAVELFYSVGMSASNSFMTYYVDTVNESFNFSNSYFSYEVFYNYEYVDTTSSGYQKVDSNGFSIALINIAEYSQMDPLEVEFYNWLDGRDINVRFNLYDVSGKWVNVMDPKDLPNGMYLVVYASAEGTGVVKVLVNR